MKRSTTEKLESREREKSKRKQHDQGNEEQKAKKKLKECMTNLCQQKTEEQRAARLKTVNESMRNLKKE